MKRMLFLAVIIGLLISLNGCEPISGCFKKRYAISTYLLPGKIVFQIDGKEGDSLYSASCYVTQEENGGEIKQKSGSNLFTKLALAHHEDGKKEFIMCGVPPGFTVLYDVRRIFLFACKKDGTKRDISKNVSLHCYNIKDFVLSGYNDEDTIFKGTVYSLTETDPQWITKKFSLYRIPKINPEEEYVLEILLTDSSKVTAVGKFRKRK